jgi:hypothetical protein
MTRAAPAGPLAPAHRVGLDLGLSRGDLALDTRMNLVHSSDGPEAAAREIALWFDEHELLEYRRDVDAWVAGS